MENEVLKTIRERRSCRRFEARQISEAELSAVLEAGTWAPTGRGAQSPVIVAVQDRATRDELSRRNAAVMGTDSDPFYGAPTVLVVLANKNANTCVEDGSLVIGNLLLAAQSIGLGACWIHRAREEFETPEGKALLKKWNVPDAENLIGVGHCILGYPAEGGKKSSAPRKKDYVIFVK
jgi:nitroreductase